MKDSDELRILRGELEGDWNFIRENYNRNRSMTTRFELQRDDEMAVIALAYTLHNLYTAWEAYFYRVAKFFENKLPPETWHRELLARMELDIPGIRPAVFDADTGAAFDELRRFRHIFRNLYKSKLQRERVDWVNRQAVGCYENFRTSHEKFIRWIDGLIEIEERKLSP